MIDNLSIGTVLSVYVHNTLRIFRLSTNVSCPLVYTGDICTRNSQLMGLLKVNMKYLHKLYADFTFSGWDIAADVCELVH